MNINETCAQLKAIVCKENLLYIGAIYTGWCILTQTSKIVHIILPFKLPHRLILTYRKSCIFYETYKIHYKRLRRQLFNRHQELPIEKQIISEVSKEEISGNMQRLVLAASYTKLEREIHLTTKFSRANSKKSYLKELKIMLRPYYDLKDSKFHNSIIILIKEKSYNFQHILIQQEEIEKNWI